MDTTLNQEQLKFLNRVKTVGLEAMWHFRVPRYWWTGGDTLSAEERLVFDSLHAMKETTVMFTGVPVPFGVWSSEWLSYDSEFLGDDVGIHHQYKLKAKAEQALLDFGF